MKGIVLAATACAFFAVECLLLFRLVRREPPVVFTVALVGAIAAYLVAFLVAPADLGFLPAELVEGSRVLELLNGLVILILVVHSAADALYTSVFTGFSTNLVVLIDREGGRSREELHTIHGVEDPLDRLVVWRLPGLIASRYVEAEGADRYRLLPKGEALARFTAFMNRALTGRAEGA